MHEIILGCSLKLLDVAQKFIQMCYYYTCKTKKQENILCQISQKYTSNFTYADIKMMTKNVIIMTKSLNFGILGHMR